MAFVRTRISVSGFTAAEVQGGLADLLDEFRDRPWIVQPTASWDAPRRRLVVTTHYKGDDPDRLGRAASDEVWDCVLACINFSSKGVRFQVEESIVVPKAEPDVTPDRGGPKRKGGSKPPPHRGA